MGSFPAYDYGMELPKLVDELNLDQPNPVIASKTDVGSDVQMSTRSHAEENLGRVSSCDGVRVLSCSDIKEA